MELSAAQRSSMLGARRRLLADMGALMRQRERVVGLLAAAAAEPAAQEQLSLDALACDGSAQVGRAPPLRRSACRHRCACDALLGSLSGRQAEG